MLHGYKNPPASPFSKGAGKEGDFFPRIGVLHGQLPEAEISETMHAFDTGTIDILVCSTIIENGLDLPNVNTLIVPNAIRFGLAQLYQIRGRIGRGARKAYALFMYQRTKLSPLARRRLETIETMNHAGAGDFKPARTTANPTVSFLAQTTETRN